MAKPRSPKSTARSRSSAPECSIVLDGWGEDLAAWLWSNPRAKPLRDTFTKLARYLANRVDRPQKVRLVIAADLAAAINARANSNGYHLTRGSGTVGGRTMAVGDGIDVLINANFLVDIDPKGDPIPKPAGVEMMFRTLVHEAQHVTMRQRQSGFESYGRDEVAGWIAVFVFDIAAKMCDEYRAEYNAIEASTPQLPSESAVLDVFEALGGQLAAADDRYQDSHDVEVLMNETLAACEHGWTTLAYWAAQWRHAGTLEQPPTEISELALWQRYIGDTWPALAAAFNGVPVNLTTTPRELHVAACRLAQVLDAVLEVVGFDYADDPEPVFYIRRDDFPSDRS